MALTPKQNHLVLPLINWFRENNAEPYISILKEHPGVIGLPDVVMKNENPLVTLGLGMTRMGYFNTTVNEMLFSMRFSGKSCDIVVPFEAVLAVFDRAASNEAPIIPFDMLTPTTEFRVTFDMSHAIESAPQAEAPAPNPPKKPGLRVVK